MRFAQPGQANYATGIVEKLSYHEQISELQS